MSGEEKGFRTFVGKSMKWGAIGGLAGGLLMAAPLVVGAIRNSRRANDDEPLPPPPELTAPLPQVLEAPPMPINEPTLMGEPLVRDGKFGRQVKAGRSGGMDVNTTAPDLIRADGRNAIDGSKGVQDMGAVPGGRGF
ncbi:MAG: hypothetical protein EBV03_02645 [Proteobacteria bacterium]|nr:hypothetical protein [Pseudomonadota bacterium]